MATKHVSARTVTVVIVALCALFATGAYTLGVMNMKSEVPANATPPKSPKAKPQEASTDTGLLAITADDVVIGATDAPVTIVEYFSLSCPGCANFHNNELPQFQKEYLDTGKAKLVVRSFPLNAPALKGAQLVACAPADERAKFLKVLFEMQSDWAFTPGFNDKLKQIATVGGMNNETFDACMNDKKAEEALIAKTQQASEKLKIAATPSFFVGNTPYTGPVTSEGLGKAVESAQTN